MPSNCSYVWLQLVRALFGIQEMLDVVRRLYCINSAQGQGILLLGDWESQQKSPHHNRRFSTTHFYVSEQQLIELRLILLKMLGLLFADSIRLAEVQSLMNFIFDYPDTSVLADVRAQLSE